MQSIDHLNLNKPERERGLKKVVELYWKKGRRQKWGKKVPLFYSSHQYWISLSSSITLKSQPHHIGHLASYVCIQIQAMAYISFSTDVVLGENASNLFLLKSTKRMIFCTHSKEEAAREILIISWLCFKIHSYTLKIVDFIKLLVSFFMPVPWIQMNFWYQVKTNITSNYSGLFCNEIYIMLNSKYILNNYF